MSSALKSGLEKFIHDFFGSIVVHKPSWHHQYVGIVVLAYEMGNLWKNEKCTLRELKYGEKTENHGK